MYNKLLAILCLACTPIGADGGEPPGKGVQRSDTPHVTYFAFDDRSILLQDNLQLTLVPATKHPSNPVLRCGEKGSPDYGHAILYGSIVEVDGRFRMWYLGMSQRETIAGQAPGYWRPMCYAESEDGIHWTKPDLGLVEFNGDKKNNICLVEGDEFALTRVDDFLTVLHEPDEPDPARRYKAAFTAHVPWDEVKGGIKDVGAKERRLCAMVCAVSGDGLRWKVVRDRPAVAEKFEVSGLYRFGEFYYAGGQQGPPWVWLPDGAAVGRAMTVFRSPDFVNWSSGRSLAFTRVGQRTRPPLKGQQAHMGAGLWNRGNVLVGLYGLWQDGPAKKPPGSTHLWGMRCDLGLVVSNDGLHFREPVPDHRVLAHGRPGQWDSIALLQGHAFANRGDKTLLWYSHWDCEGQFRSMEIGLATLRRDGFGYLSPRHSTSGAHLVTRIVPAGSEPAEISLNISGVSTAQPLRVHLLDELDRPLPGYSGENAAEIRGSSTRSEVVWPAHRSAKCPRIPFGVKVEFPRKSAARLYAIYVD